MSTIISKKISKKLCYYLCTPQGCTYDECNHCHDLERCRYTSVYHSYSEIGKFIITNDGKDEFFVSWNIVESYLKQNKINFDSINLSNCSFKCIYDIDSKKSSYGKRFIIMKITEIIPKNQSCNTVSASTNVNETTSQSGNISINAFRELELKLLNMQDFLKKNKNEQSKSLEQQIRESDMFKLLIDKRDKHQRNKMDEHKLKIDEIDKHQQKKMDEHKKRIDYQQKRVDEQQKRVDEQQKRMDEQQKKIDEHQLKIDEHQLKIDEHQLKIDYKKKRTNPPLITSLRRSKRQCQRK